MSANSRSTGSFNDRIENARKELLETSTRSRLLHTPIDSARAKIILVIGESSSQVFDLLVTKGKAMSFLSHESNQEPSDPAELLLPAKIFQPNQVELGATDQTDNRLQTRLAPEILAGRLRSIAYDAQSFESEQGVNLLYLALGFLKWFENKDREKPRFAPLLLVPVQLARVKINERFSMTCSGAEITTNLPLQQRLKQEDISLPSLPEIDEIDVDGYAKMVAASINKMPDWEVLPDTIALGFYSFAKLMMYRDLDPNCWPAEESLNDNALLYGLLSDGFAVMEDQLVAEDVPVDPIIDICSAGHVVDADSSQMLVIHDVRCGRNMVIEGPPGTGKSQTITNVIAAAVQDGKTVLFVAEKMAALNIVKGNLDKIGLGQICLELHSQKANKKAVLENLEQTYCREINTSGQPPSVAEELRKARNLLNEHAESINQPLLPSGATPFDIFTKLALLSGQGIALPEFQLSLSQSWTKKEIVERVAATERIASHIIEMGIPNAHPWRGVCIDIVLPADSERLASAASVLDSGLTALVSEYNSLLSKIGLSCSTLSALSTVAKLGDLLKTAPDMDPKWASFTVWESSFELIKALVKAGLDLDRTFRELESVVTEEAFSIDLSVIIHEISAHGGSPFRWFRKTYRSSILKFRSIIREGAIRKQGEKLALLSKIVYAQNRRTEIENGSALGLLAFGTRWMAEACNWKLLMEIVDWQLGWKRSGLPANWKQEMQGIPDLNIFGDQICRLTTKYESLQSDLKAFFGTLSLDLAERFEISDIGALELLCLHEHLSAMATSANRLQQWCIWRTLCKELVDLGLKEFLERIRDDRIGPKQASASLQYAIYESLARKVMAERKNLAFFDGRSHERILEDFKRFDIKRMEQSRIEVLLAHRAKRPTTDRDLGEIGVLRREWRKQRRILPIRQLFKSAGNAIQLIKPVWMMSPLSLAQFLEPGIVKFDMVLMDEASQIRPIDALGAVARGKQLVVVGDEKQLPPTSFFDRAMHDELQFADNEEFLASDMESILGLCSSQGIPSRMLRWHYRSQHESLIAVSNQEFYKKLFIVPSSFSTDVGLRFRKVKGIYDRGKSATNRIEAREIAVAIIEHARKFGTASRYPTGMSLGVGTFSVAQRDAILDELEVLRKQNLEVESFFEAGGPEPFFIKNLETIQGDERDVIFISVGYGPDESGIISMGFGPLTAKGGERRLNVLITRARRRCEVFSSLSSSDIDLSRTQSIGVRVLRAFLQYAETGHLDRAIVKRRGIDSDFEEDVGSCLATLGYPVEHQVGVAGFFIDLAIKDINRPGCFILGIECDGAAYHSSLSARDRDRLREQVLRDRGWRIHRIWGTDWYRRRDVEIQRLVNAISVATHYSKAEETSRQAPRNAEFTNNSDPINRQDAIVIATRKRKYAEADIYEGVVGDAHLLPLSRRLDIILRIVKIEGPIHEQELARRYATTCGKEKTGSRILQAVQETILYGKKKNLLIFEAGFCTIELVDKVIPRDRSGVKSLTLKSPQMISPLECITGLIELVKENIGLKKQDAIVEVARMFGFQRTGQEICDFIETQCNRAISSGAIKVKNGDFLYPSV